MKGAKESSIVNVSGKAVVLEEFMNSLMKKKYNSKQRGKGECKFMCDVFLFSFTLPDSLIEKRANKIGAKSLA